MFIVPSAAILEKKFERDFPTSFRVDSEAEWSFETPEEWREFARVDDDSAELIIGVNENQPHAHAELVDLIAKYGGKFVGRISMGGSIKAVVADMPFRAASSFVTKARNSGLSRYVEPNLKFQACLEPNDPLWPSQWGPKKIEADYAWNETTGEPGVLVAVIDTGIDYTNPDLKPVSEGGNYVPLGIDWVNNDNNTMDDMGHGTHCAGIIAATLNNNEGIAGLAQVHVMAEKGLDANGGGWDDDLANATIHAVDVGADIISMSWGGSPSELLHDAMRYAYDRGVLLVAAAGNDASSSHFYPAAFDEVVAVTATDMNDNPASFTNYGSWVEVAAPGVRILSTVSYEHDPYFTDYPYCYANGTSMACPHVSGVAALIWSRFPNLTRDLVRMHLWFTADDLGNPDFDVYYGYGRVNARKAVETSPADHDLALARHDVNLIGYENHDQFQTSIRVYNYGTNNESDITVQLLVNDTQVESKSIGFLASGNSTAVDFTWTPMYYGTYKIACSVVQVPGETITDNNSKWKYAVAPLEPRFSVDPLLVTAVLGSNFNVNVNLDDVEYADVYEVWVTFNTTTLDAVAVADGPFPGVIWYQINNNMGRVIINCSEEIYGSGTVAIITFNVQAEGTTILDLYSTKIRQIIGGNVVPVYHRATDGFFTTTIQEAVDEASISSWNYPGNTVHVTAGTYYEQITVNKPLTLIGEDSATTVIDGGGANVVVRVTASNVSFQGFRVQNGYQFGIYLESDNNTVSGNVVLNITAGGIGAGDDATNNRISDNLIANCQFGICLFPWTHNNIIDDNAISNTDIYAIWLWDSSFNQISTNTISNNTNGIILDVSTNNLIIGNKITLNTHDGVYLLESNSNTIVENMISNHTKGIHIHTSNDNVIYHNNFINNTIQAYVEPSAIAPNTWDNGYTAGGNYWRNYNGTDANDDGIGDTPYNIALSNQDNYPLIYPWPVNDIAVTSVTVTPTEVLDGNVVSITVSVINQGTESETFNVTAYYDSNAIETQTVTNLSPRSSEMLTFTWVTTNVSPGTHTIKAIASTVFHEADTDDNLYVDGSVTVVEKIFLSVVGYSSQTAPYTADKTVDGSYSWPCGWQSGKREITNQWIKYYLGTSYNLTCLKIFPYGSGYGVKNFKLLVSIDGVTYTQAYANTTQDSATLQSFELPGIIARYVELYFVDNYCDPSYIRVNEFELYGYVYQNDAGSGGDAGNTFNEATAISLGSYTGYAAESFDPDDWYKFGAASGQFIDVTMIPPSSWDYDLYLYDPLGNLKASSVASGNATEHILFKTNSAGDWRIRISVCSSEGKGQYSFTASIKNAMHVESISFWRGWKGQTETLYIQVMILDQNGNPVSDATVSGTLVPVVGGNEFYSNPTELDGTVTFTYSVKNSELPIGTYTFTVTNVQKTDWIYDSAANKETSDWYTKGTPR